MTEDPRQTRGNGPDPRTAQSRSARSGGGPLVASRLGHSRVSGSAGEWPATQRLTLFRSGALVLEDRRAGLVFACSVAGRVPGL